MNGNTSAVVSDKLKELELSKLKIQNKIINLESLRVSTVIEDATLIRAFDKLQKSTQAMLDSQDMDQIKKMFYSFVDSIKVDNEQVEIEYNLEQAVGSNIVHVFDENAPKNVKTRPIMDVHTSGGDGGNLLSCLLIIFLNLKR